MNITAKIVVGLALTASLSLAGATVYAQNTPTTVSARDENVQTTNQVEQKRQLSADEQKELKTRLDKRKADLKTKLSTADQQRLKTKCKASQTVMGNVSNRIKTIESNRTEIYGGLISRLSLMSSRLQNQGLDKQLIQTHIDALQGMITTYDTDLAAYKQALSDLQAMDCVSDPAGFKASLETARTAQAKLKADAKAIRTYVNDNVKPTLQQIRGQLQ